MRQINVVCRIVIFLFLTSGIVYAQEKLYPNEFPLSNIKLLEGPFKDARDLNIQTLLKYDVDRLLAGYRKEAGLSAKAISYYSWDGLDEHVGGHYLSAMAMNYAATNNAECKKRMEYMIEELQACQDMLKLTEDLFRVNSLAKYAYYYERTLYNHILSTQHPEHGGYVYFTPARPRHYRVYSSPNEAMWCCVGSGMENHGKYNQFIYTHQHDSLFLNLFIASELNWKEKGIKLKQETSFFINEQYSVLYGKKSLCTNTANEVVVSFENPSKAKLNIIIRVYNDGIAFRYEFPEKQGSFTMKDEFTSSDIPKETTRWMEKWNPENEGLYTAMNDDKIQNLVVDKAASVHVKMLRRGGFVASLVPVE